MQPALTTAIPARKSADPARPRLHRRHRLYRPGNFATNIQAGSTFGYQLLWVVVWANLMAMLVQTLSAKLGIVTGKNPAEHIRDRLPRPAVWAYGCRPRSSPWPPISPSSSALRSLQTAARHHPAGRACITAVVTWGILML
jgi:manganese transport protein